MEDDPGSDKEHDSDTSEPDEKYEEAYYQGVIQAMEMNEEMGRCFNCNEPGHKWRECTKPRKEELRHVYEWMQSLNTKQDARKKAGHVPRSGTMGPAPVAVKA